MAETRRSCELCNAKASLYCPSDSAFLCRSCDARVHSANFLVARHLRSSLCPTCGNHDGRRFSGSGLPLSETTSFLCRSCSAERDSDSLSCVSSTTDAGADASEKKRDNGGRAVAVADKRIEVVLVNWCRRMAVDERRVVPTAVKVLAVCVGGMTMSPFRVCLTASFWVALRISRGAATCHDVRRLEQISGLPAKLVLALGSRIARMLRRRRSRENREEGWAEC